MLTDQWFRRVWELPSLVLFLVMAAAHLAAVTGLFVVPPIVIVPLFLPLFVGQIVVIEAFRWGRTIGEQFLSAWWWARNQWRAVRLGMKLVPRPWLALMLVLWFLYLPGMFFGWLAVTRGRELSDRWSTVMTSLFYGVFFLLHYLMLRYIIPRKDEIGAKLEAPE